MLILCEHVMSAHFSQQVAAVQLTPTQLSITQFTTGAHLALQSDMHVQGVCVTKVRVKTRSLEGEKCRGQVKNVIDIVTGCVLSYRQDSVTVWSGKKVTVYELSGTVLRNTGTRFEQKPH